MKKLTIALISGGASSEREVSLKSGDQVHKALDKEKYKVIRYDPKTEINRLVADAPMIDAGLIILHGPFGEDGTVQGFLDLLGIPYQGTGVLGSAIAMNKLASKKFYEKAGLSVPPYIAFNRGEEINPEKIAYQLGLPLVVKPVQGGSSIGMSIIKSAATLKHAVDIAFEQDNSILIETYIKGIEITVSVIGNEKLEALPVVEIIPGKGHEFFDYEAKYTAGLTQETCPAIINEDLTKKAQEYAKTAHSALFCKGYSRTDMILKNNDIYVLETNTIPGMTPTSLLPLAAATAGISFSELLDKLIALSMRPLKNVQFCSSSRKAKILTAGIH
ncbi:MAG: D-alanine--D-alanine ligase [Deltaproteobacteria bacterium]|nr:D-alanine--D-alanine ligase [Deltaproteobacteria bacterium]